MPARISNTLPISAASVSSISPAIRCRMCPTPPNPARSTVRLLLLCPNPAPRSCSERVFYSVSPGSSEHVPNACKDCFGVGIVNADDGGVGDDGTPAVEHAERGEPGED